MRERFDVPLADLTTLRLGGPAKRLVEVESAEELVEVLRAADAEAEPVLVLGGGSNVVVADEGFPGTVVRVGDPGIVVESSDAAAGPPCASPPGRTGTRFVVRAVAEGWVGVEALSGIPGLVGAAPIQNVGAYGQEVSQTIAQVRVWDRVDGAVRTLAAADCGFGYRTSRFKRDPERYVVLEVVFQLRLGDVGAPVAYTELARTLGVDTGDRVPLSDVRQAVLGLRRGQGHGARPRRPRHLERGFVLHQPRAAGRRRRGPPARRAALSRGRREGQDECGLADRARGFRQGATAAGRSSCPPSTRSR